MGGEREGKGASEKVKEGQKEEEEEMWVERGCRVCVWEKERDYGGG